MMQTKETKTRKMNGVDVDRLFETIDAIKASPVIAKFRFSLENEWMDCGHNRSTIKGFHGAGEDMNHKQQNVLCVHRPVTARVADRGAGKRGGTGLKRVVYQVYDVGRREHSVAVGVAR